MDNINVILIDRRKRDGSWYLRYTNPITGERVEISAKTKSEREARKQAGVWQAELASGVDSHGRVTTWDEFRRRYEDDHAFNLKESTASDICCVFNVIESVMKPDKVSRITPQWLTTFMKRRLDVVVPATLEGDFRVLKAALNWAHNEGLIANVPKFPKIKKARKAKTMKGRPITGEEFDRMLAAVDYLPERQHDSIRFLLRGLWLSGLRLGEALSLTWDLWADGIRVDMSDEFTVLLINAEDEKGGRDREYPITPDFDELLRSVPESDRTGHVFNPVLYRGVCHRIDTVSKTLVDIGKRANVKVDSKTVRNRKTGKAEIRTSYASAHDLRRAFGNRWAMWVKSIVLKELMRHESVSTTEKYYVQLEAQETGRHLRAVFNQNQVSQGESRGESIKKGVSADD